MSRVKSPSFDANPITPEPVTSKFIAASSGMPEACTPKAITMRDESAEAVFAAAAFSAARASGVMVPVTFWAADPHAAVTSDAATTRAPANQVRRIFIPSIRLQGAAA